MPPSPPAPDGGGAAPTVSVEVKVGVLLSLTGPDAEFGAASRNAFELAIERANLEGALPAAHRRIRLVFEDDRSTTQEAARAVKRLLEADVVAVLGEIASSRSLAGGLIANAAHIPMLTPASTAPEVTANREWVFRACFDDVQQGQAAARVAKAKTAKGRVAILYAAEDTYSSLLARAFRDEATKIGLTVVHDRGFRRGETSFTKHLTAVRAAKPELVFVPVYYTDMIPIGREAKQAGLPASSLLGADGWQGPDLLAAVGSELEGARFLTHWLADAPSPKSRRFVGEFAARYGHEPDSTAALAYDGAALLADAVARSTEPTPQAIRTALVDTKGFEGVAGSINFGPDRTATKSVFVAKITGGHFVYASDLPSR